VEADRQPRRLRGQSQRRRRNDRRRHDRGRLPDLPNFGVGLATAG
jgi:hypothetical protein